jgi:AcrR family transcriptional regulator
MGSFMQTTEKKTNSGNSGKRTRRGPFTRQQILDASLRLFSERGFARTTVRDIARQAGITDAAIYYHFESKRELLEALVEERGFLARIGDLERVEAELPVREMMIAMANGAIAIMDENRDFLRLIIMEGLGGDEAALEQYSRLLDRWEAALATVVRRYGDKGEVAVRPPDDIARHIIYTILMAFQDSLLGRHSLDAPAPEERQRKLSEFIRPALERVLDAVSPARQA